MGGGREDGWLEAAAATASSLQHVHTEQAATQSVNCTYDNICFHCQRQAARRWMETTEEEQVVFLQVFCVEGGSPDLQMHY